VTEPRMILAGGGGGGVQATSPPSKGARCEAREPIETIKGLIE